MPTSSGDISFTVNKLAEMKVIKDSKVIITSIPEAEVSKNLDVIYISEEDSKGDKEIFNKGRFQNPIILDTSDYSYNPTIKINQIGFSHL